MTGFVPSISDSQLQTHSSNREPIAIIGIGCRFPGKANSPEAFWKLLRDGVDAITEVPANRWNLHTFYDPDPEKPGKTYARWGGFIEGIDEFDAQFFGMSPREASRSDPQQRILMEVAYEALEDAGQVPERLAGSMTGVFVGISSYEFGAIQSAMSERVFVDAYTNLGAALSIAANRISYFFDFRGPSMAVDTACSSSLVSTHLACQSIWEGECTLALTCGVNVIVKPEGTMGFSKASMLSPDGRCKSFDAGANGFVCAEGAGVVVLKPLSHAQADGDTIYAIIRGSAVNQDGHTGGIAVPNPEAQAAMLREAYKQAGIPLQAVQYVEAHGTGTAVGDPIEANALGKVLGMQRSNGDACLIGSVKSNIGHLEAGSGIAGLIKTALCLKYRQIPPNLHFETPNPQIPFERLGLRVPQSLEPWPDTARPIAGVNSFGFGGTNAHVIVEAAPEPEARQRDVSIPVLFRIGGGYRKGLDAQKITRGLRTAFEAHAITLPQEAEVSIESPSHRWRITNGKRTYTIQRAKRQLNIYDTSRDGRAYLFPVSARSPEALEAFAQSYLTFLQNEASQADVSLSDICYTASMRRGHHSHRLALAGHSKEELAEHLQAFLDGETRLTLSSGRPVPGNSSQIVFVFSGMGPQWWAMGRELLKEEPIFRETIKRCDTLLQQLVDWSLWDEMTVPEARSRINETRIAQPAIFSLQVALAALWRSWGVEPDAIVGHSVGEVAAAHVAGVLNLEDAVLLIFHRSRLQQQTAGEGKMLAVGLPWREVEEISAEYSERVSIAAINSPSAVTLSGDADALDEIAALLEQRGIFCRFLQVEVPYHSPRMEPLKAELLASLKCIQPHPTVIPLFSTVTGKAVEGPELDGHYWCRNLRDPVRFAAAMEGLIETGHDLFLEVSPHPVLASSIAECLSSANKEGTSMPSLRRREPERAMMLGSLGKLYTVGYPVDWRRLYPQENGSSPRRFVQLPAYPWQREPHWQESEESLQDRLGRSVHPLLGKRLKSVHPAWSGKIDKLWLSYLDDHRVQGTVVYPAAAFVEMALAAVKEIVGEEPAILEEIEFQKALFLPDGEAINVQLVVDSSQASFEIFSKTDSTEASWARHVTGNLRSLQNGYALKSVALDELRSRCTQEIAKADCYQQFQAADLQYGPFFQRIERLWSGDREAVGKLQNLDDVDAEKEGYYLHPAILDACFQVLLGAVSLNGIDGGEAGRVYLPVKIDRVRIYGRPKQGLWSHARLVEQNETMLRGDIQLLDDQGNVLAEVQGLRCQPLAGMQAAVGERIDKYLYQYQWSLDARSGKNLAHSPADDRLSPQEISMQVKAEAVQLSEQLRRNQHYDEVLPLVDRMGAAYVLSAFRELGWDLGAHQRVSEETLVEHLGVVPRHHRLLGRLLQILQEDGVLRQVDDAWEVCQIPGAQNPHQIWKSLMAQYPAYQAEFRLLGRCGQNLAKALRGEMEPLELIFPEGSSTTAEHLYQDAPTMRIYNLLLGKVIAAALEQLPKGRTVRILEIGAGTGGSTAYILPGLKANRTEYVCTDISPQFTAAAEQKFYSYRFVNYQVLDIEADPIEQGFDAHSFDIILASDVLHATRDLRQTLGNVKRLLAPEGLLVLLELTNHPRMTDLTFGLLEGWWLFSDYALRPTHPLLSWRKWQALLKEVGFGEVAGVSDIENPDEAEQTIILAQSPPSPQEEEALPMSAAASNVSPEPEKPGSWLIFADGSGVGRQLAQQLKGRNQTPILISIGETYERIDAGHFRIRPEYLEDMQQLLCDALVDLPACRGAVHLWSLDAPRPEKTTAKALENIQGPGCLSVLHLVQALDKAGWNESPRLWLVTSGTQDVGGLKSISVVQSPLWGLGRVIVNEQPRLRTRMVDVSPASSSEEVAALFEELWSDDAEDEIALRGEMRYVHRLVRVPLADMGTSRQASAEAQSFQLEISTPGILDNLIFRETTRQKPGPGAVEIEVCATALNFKDVAKAMGLLGNVSLEGTASGRAVGLECAGRIAAIGPGVKGFRVGDEVIAFAPNSFGAFTIADARFVAPMPANLSFEEAATVALVFVTAYYALHHLGHIQKGERVLIHAAAGGVGLAAIQLAQLAGAEIFATAGNTEKREFLRGLGVQHVMDSRSLTFAEEVMEITCGQGVDLVLNSLAGEAMSKSLSVLGAYGRFLEIGKRDIEQNRKLGLRPFNNNLSFYAIDLDRLAAERPDFVGTLFGEVIPLFEDGSLRPLPHRVFPISEVVNAFRHMAQAKHIGKIVVSLQNAEVQALPSEVPVTFQADGTYLITGGLGGFGLAVAQWLVAHGARHLVLMGRSGASSPAAQAAVAALKQANAEVVVAKADVTQENQVAEVLADIRRAMPPLRGIIHGAMVLDDAVLLQLNRERLQKVMAPKAIGAWNLHIQTLDTPLDFFILFSSFASLVGNPGQGNYVAASVFLDTLAYYRHAQNLPALTVNWGVVADVGYVAEDTSIAERLERLGAIGFRSEQALKILGQLLHHDVIQTAVLPADWQRLAQIHEGTPSPRFEKLLAEADQDQLESEAGAGIGDFRNALLATPPAERQELLASHLCEQLARVLGTSASKLDVEQPLMDMGLDSLMAVEMRNRIQTELGVDVPPMKFMEGLSIAKLATFVIEQLPSDDREVIQI